MRDIIIKSPDADFLASEAARLGLSDDEGNIATNGSFKTGGGWFFNIVGTVYEDINAPKNPDDPMPEPVARDGYWGRLRINGEPEEMPTFASTIVQYVWSEKLQGWTSDGKKLAPEWVGAIGMIA